MSDQERANELIEQANALHDAGRKLEAAPMYVEAAALFAPYGPFALVAGDSYRGAGQHEQAVEAYRACLPFVPDHEDAWDGLGASLHTLGRTDEAREAYAKTGKPFPGDAKPGFLERWFGIG